MSDTLTKQWPVSFEEYELLTEEEREVARIQCLASHQIAVQDVEKDNHPIVVLWSKDGEFVELQMSSHENIQNDIYPVQRLPLEKLAKKLESLRHQSTIEVVSGLSRISQFISSQDGSFHFNYRLPTGPDLILSSGHQLKLPEHGDVEIADIELVINDKTATAMLLLKVLKTGATLRLPLNQLVAEGIKIGHS